MREEQNCAANIHGVVENIEGEPSHLVTHQDTKVVTKEGAFCLGMLAWLKEEEGRTTLYVQNSIPVIPSCKNDVITNVKPTAPVHFHKLTKILSDVTRTQNVRQVQEHRRVQFCNTWLRFESERVPTILFLCA